MPDERSVVPSLLIEQGVVDAVLLEENDFIQSAIVVMDGVRSVTHGDLGDLPPNPTRVSPGSAEVPEPVPLD